MTHGPRSLAISDGFCLLFPDMGHAYSCVAGKICGGRGFPPEFVAPNRERVTFEYSCCSSLSPAGKAFIKSLAEGGEALFCSPSGVLVSPRSSGRLNRGCSKKLFTVKECSNFATDIKLVVSGRFFVQCPTCPDPFDDTGDITDDGRLIACAMKLCTRGQPIFESVRTQNYTHTANVITSGIFFVLRVEAAPEGFYINPRIMLVVECGDELLLVEDRLGPLPGSLAFYADFAILDECGKNMQMDLLLRLPAEANASGSLEGRTNGHRMGMCRTLRTCLQDYTTFNNQAARPIVGLCQPDLSLLPPDASVHLQHLVISEERTPQEVLPLPFTGFPLMKIPNCGRSNSSGHTGEKRSSLGKAVDSGKSTLAASAVAAFCAGGGERPFARSPEDALVPVGKAYAQDSCEDGLILFVGSVLRQQFDTTGPNAVADDEDNCKFWYRVRYGGNENTTGTRGIYGGDIDIPAPLKGEFWLTREPVEKRNVYLQCSSTLAQAATMCIIFRFSCPTDYLSLIENQASGVLQDLHIPTNGVVLGVEIDPRHPSLYRMFIEHRNEILDDIVVCECCPANLHTTVVHQEVYDSGETIFYRVSFVFTSGARKQVCLELPTEKVECDDRLFEEPSMRWPISPCVHRQLLSPASRIFIYSSKLSQLKTEEDEEKLNFDTPTRRNRDWCSTTSEGVAEDWQSAGGGVSDYEADSVPTVSANRRVEWPRPLVDSMLLMSMVTQPPFKSKHGHPQ